MKKKHLKLKKSFVKVEPQVAPLQPPKQGGGGFKAIAINNLNGIYNNDFVNGIRKKGIPFSILRQIADRDAIIRICINTIKKAVSQSDYGIRIRENAPKDKKYYFKKRDALLDKFTNLNDNKENFRVLLDRTCEDLLVLDAAGIEIRWNMLETEWVGLNSVDGASIRPRFNEYGELDPEAAYVQFIMDKRVATFKSHELVYIMANPQNSVEFFGYGKSPIESIILQIQARMEADMYNMKQFTKDNVPPGILDLGNMSDEEAQTWIATWNATVIGNTQALKFVWGSDQEKKFIPFNTSNKDMQFTEYQDWLARLILATYGLSSQEANIFQDVNRGTAEVQAQRSQSGGIKNIKKIISEYITRELIYVLGGDYEYLEFYFKDAEMISEKKLQAEVDAININSGIYSPTEVRLRDGFVSEMENPVKPQNEGTPASETTVNDNTRQPKKVKITN